jgi:hypothetical protein
MTYSKGSVVVGGERPVDGGAGGVVVPDHRGQGQDGLQYAHDHPCWGVAAPPEGVACTAGAVAVLGPSSQL